MNKRILEANASDFKSMNSLELLNAIRMSEGRTLVSEIIVNKENCYMPSYPELACAFGADILLLNIFDVLKPSIKGIGSGKSCIKKLKEYCGRPIGINLEPAPLLDSGQWALSEGRQATVNNAKIAKEMGVDFILLTGNPGNQVYNQEIIKALKSIKKELGDDLVLMAGKMHASGIDEEGNENILSFEDIEDFAKSGADVILLPAPATVPGVDLNYVKERVRKIHSLNCLAMSAIGTSQEGSDVDTIREIALLSKQAGVDIHHIGDSGLNGMAVPENIMTYSLAIKGRRHTYFRMASSLKR